MARQGLVGRGRPGRAGRRRGHDGAGHRGVDRAAGRLEDGARPRRRIRREDPAEAVRLARLLPGLPARAGRPPQTALGAEPRPARASRLHGLARRSSIAGRSSAAPRSPTRCWPISSAGGCGSASADAAGRSRPPGRPGWSRPPRCSCSGSASGSIWRRPRGVIDVGLAGVVGASRILDGEAPYGNMPQRGDLEPCGPKDADGQVRERIQTNGRCEAAIERGDTYGPVSYLAYVPATAVFGWSGKWDSLPAAHATSIAFDLLAILGLVLVGLRFGGRRLAVLLAFGWTAYPFTAYTLNANTNDAIMPAFLLLGFWLVTSDWARGASVALAGLDEVRRASRRTAVGDLPDPRAPAAPPVRRGVRGRDGARVLDPPARAVARGCRADVLGSDDRLPDRTRFTVLDLGLGPVPRARDPRPRVPAAGGCRARRRAGRRARVRPAPEGARRARGAHRRGPRRLPAHADPLVLPLPPVDRPVRPALAAAPAAGGLRTRRRGRPRSRTPCPSRSRTR